MTAEATRTLREHVTATYPRGSPVRVAVDALKDDAPPGEVAAVAEVVLKLLASKDGPRSPLGVSPTERPGGGPGGDRRRDGDRLE